MHTTMKEEAISETHMIPFTEIRRAWHLPSIDATTKPTMGTIHQIFLLSTKESTYVLRAYRHTAKDQRLIVYEHAIAAYVKAHGLPAITPLPLPSGETLLEHEGHFYALFPRALGAQIPREHLTSPEIIDAMGHCLGELHRLLAAYPHDRVRHRSFTVDPQATLHKIGEIEAAIAAKGHRDEVDQATLTMLAQRRAWLISAHIVEAHPFASFPQQVLHGDYQETNLFFTDNMVSAIIDWDQSCVAPRAYEILRVMHYVFALDGTRCRAFLHAYRQRAPISSEELNGVAKAYGWLQANSLWAYSSYYLEHNQRVLGFLDPGPFLPFEERWAALQPFLDEPSDVQEA